MCGFVGERIYDCFDNEENVRFFYYYEGLGFNEVFVKECVCILGRIFWVWFDLVVVIIF